MRIGAVIAAAVLLTSGPALRAQRPVQDQAILQYLSQTNSWYLDVTAFVNSPAGSRERLFADDLRNSSSHAVRLAFDFARAQAAIPSANAPAQADPGRGRNLAQAEAAADQRADQAQAQIEQINRQLESASPKALARLLALRDEVTSELNFAKARRDSLRKLIGFFSGSGEGGLGAKINDLARSVPELTSQQQRGPEKGAANVGAASAQDFHPESAGLIGLTTEILAMSGKMSRLDHLTQVTESLRQANQGLRAPLRSALQEVIRSADEVSQRPESADPAALIAQRKEMDALAARFKQVSGSTVPLSEQSAQINASRGHMLEWRRVLDEDHSRALRYLALRAGMLAAGLVLIFGFSELWRRATMRYVSDLRRRRQFLLLRRIVVTCMIVLFLILSFVTEFGSFATFAGFSAAGIAVAMQSVILSVVAYFFLVGRWGVRAGDRVTVSGVTGEVVEVGLFRLYLMELGGSEIALEPTGRIVVFPNSVFFQPAALFKQLPGIDYAWRTLNLKIMGATDAAQVESRLLAAVESIYAEYRETVEGQHRAAQSSLNLHTPIPRVESRVRIADSNLEMTIRYPVEIGRAREIDDRISRKVIEEVEREPKLRLADGSTPKVEIKRG